MIRTEAELRGITSEDLAQPLVTRAEAFRTLAARLAALRATTAAALETASDAGEIARILENLSTALDAAGT